jgi:hypothetical protein
MSDYDGAFCLISILLFFVYSTLLTLFTRIAVIIVAQFFLNFPVQPNVHIKNINALDGSKRGASMQRLIILL